MKTKNKFGHKFLVSFFTIIALSIGLVMGSCKSDMNHEGSGSQMNNTENPVLEAQNAVRNQQNVVGSLQERAEKTMNRIDALATRLHAGGRAISKEDQSMLDTLNAQQKSIQEGIVSLKKSSGTQMQKLQQEVSNSLAKLEDAIKTEEEKLTTNK